MVNLMPSTFLRGRRFSSVVSGLLFRVPISPTGKTEARRNDSICWKAVVPRLPTTTPPPLRIAKDSSF